MEDEILDSDNDESINDDSNALSERDNSSEEDDIETDMQHVFALINSGFDEDDNKIDPKAKEERYYTDCNEALNDNEIIGCVAAEPTYEDDDYVFFDHTDPIFDNCHSMWPDGGPMPQEKMELEGVYFTGGNFSGNNLGYNPDFRTVYLEVVRERTRRPTSNAPSNLTQDSLQVVVKRVSLLLKKTLRITPQWWWIHLERLGLTAVAHSMLPYPILETTGS